MGTASYRQFSLLASPSFAKNGSAVSPSSEAAERDGAQVVTGRRSRKRHRPICALRWRRLVFEHYEPRTLLSVLTNTGTAADVVYTLPATANQVFLEDDGTSGNSMLQLRSANGTFDTTVFANPGSSLTINRGNASDTITISALPDFNASLKIGGIGSEFGTVTFAGGLTLAVNKNLAANATGTINLPNTTSDLAVSGAGTVSLTTARDISLSTGSSIASASGTITLSANQQATSTSGRFAGISVYEATITSSGGAVNLSGRGGIDDSGYNVGVYIYSKNAKVSGGSAGTAINIQGSGGAGYDGNNHGVYIVEAPVTSTGSGAVVVSGTGGNGSYDASTGVYMDFGASLRSGAGNLNVTGVGGVHGAGSTGGIGILVRSGSIINSNGGNVWLTGTGAGPAANGDGVSLFSCEVSAGGSGTLTIDGAATGDFSYGLELGFDVTVKTSNNSPITLISDCMSLDYEGISAGTGTGTVTLRPKTAKTPIAFGGDDIRGISPTLGIQDYELNSITAGTINIGDANSGAITMTGFVDRAVGATTTFNLTTAINNNITFNSLIAFNAANGRVNLFTNPAGSGAITSQYGFLGVTAANVSLTAGSGGIGVSGIALLVSATNLNAATGGNGNQYLQTSVSTTIDATGLSAGAGTIELDGGTFTLGGSNRINDNARLNVNGATFAMGASNEIVAGLTLANGSITSTTGILTSTSTYQTQRGSISATLAGSVGLTQSTSGATTLTRTNSYSGDTTISGGTLKFGANNVISDGAGKGNVVFNPVSGTATLRSRRV